MNYLSEEQLIAGVQDGGKGWLWYIENHSDELKNDYFLFCNDNDLDSSLEDSAEAFMEDRDLMFEESLSEMEGEFSAFAM